ncbi:MAG TPA: hypothetical protein VGX76_09155 [Pirellulales bacterium]|jgi:hypothetical protein|nr:hypothetical protein [Pirellulales bacterium]
MALLSAVEGVYRNGKVELLEPAPPNAAGRVIVTFLSAAQVDLAERGIDQVQAAELRRRLAAFADDWDRPEMDVYDAV